MRGFVVEFGLKLSEFALQEVVYDWIFAYYSLYVEVKFLFDRSLSHLVRPGQLVR